MGFGEAEAAPVAAEAFEAEGQGAGFDLEALAVWGPAGDREGEEGAQGLADVLLQRGDEGGEGLVSRRGCWHLG